MKKHFKQKNKFIWFILDLLVLVGCVALSEMVWELLMGDFGILDLIILMLPVWGRCIFYFHSIKAAVLMIVLIAVSEFLLIMMLLAPVSPLFAIYYGIRKAVKTNQMFRCTYDVVQHIDYYREIMKDISPATMSMLMDLKLEPRKDVAATLMCLENKKLIRVENQQVFVEQYNQSVHLTESEKVMYDLIRSGRWNFFHKKIWEDASITESIKKGYISYNKDFKKFTINMAIFMTLFIISLVVAVYSFIKIDTGEQYRVESSESESVQEDKTDEKVRPEIPDNATLKEGAKKMEEELEDPQFQKELVSLAPMIVQVVFGLISMILVIVIPIVMIVYLFVFFVSRPNYTRTRKGMRATEEIAGMMNFIHDFTILDERTKQDLALWNEFLVYAVVLEENVSIVNEIGKIRRIDLNKFF